MLHWVGCETYSRPESIKYLSSLDLSAGKELFEKCNKVWPNYDQVIKNRKFSVQQCADTAIRGGVSQVIILGAGLDPLSIELASTHPSVTVFEVDRANMSNKSALINSVAPSLLKRIHCVTAELLKLESMLDKLRNAGWDPQVPTVVVAEGISYYLSTEGLFQLLFALVSGSNLNQVVLEYLLVPESIETSFRHIPDTVFGAVIEQYKLDSVTRYDRPSLTTLSKRLRLSFSETHNMKDIELARTGKNQFFPNANSGWIEVCHIKSKIE